MPIFYKEVEIELSKEEMLEYLDIDIENIESNRMTLQSSALELRKIGRIDLAIRLEEIERNL